MRMMNDWVRIKLDPDDFNVAGGVLVRPETAYESILRTGEVLDFGAGKVPKNGNERVPLELEKGEGVVFIRFVADKTKTAEAIKQFVGPEEALIRYGDILLVYDRKDAPKFT